MNSGNSTLGEPTSIDVLSVTRELKHNSGPSSPSQQTDRGPSSSPESTTTDSASVMDALTRNTCPECGRNVKWSEHSWCDNCGYFPSAGLRVELANSLQTEEIPPGEWYRLIPGWAWVAAGGVLAIVVAAFGIRAALAENPLRPTVALGFLGTGAVLAFAAHARAYFLAIQKNDKIGLFDIVMKPMEIWKPCTRQLPRTAMTVCLGMWGTTLLASGALIIGGINYSAALDLIAVEPAEKEPPNAMHTAVAGARKMADKRNGPQDLESAVNGFVGDEEVESGAAPEPPPVAAAPVRRTLECSIFGFTRAVDGRLHSLLLAGTLPDQKRPRFVAKLPVEQVGDSATIETLSRVLPRLRVRRPYVSTTSRAQWVRPDVKCVIRYEDWSRRHGLVKPDIQTLFIPEALQRDGADDGLARR